MAKSKKDIEVGINVVQPTKEGLESLGNSKTKVPNLIIEGKGSKNKSTANKTKGGKNNKENEK